MTKFGPNPVSVVNSIHISLVIVITKEGTSPGWRISTWYDAMQICGARLIPPTVHRSGRLRLKFDGTRAETRFRLSAKRMSPFKSAGASVQSTTGSRDVRISGSNAGYTMFGGSVKSAGYPLHSPASPSLPLPCVTVCHHVSTGLYR
jgi:hypothetical protein